MGKENSRELRQGNLLDLRIQTVLSLHEQERKKQGVPQVWGTSFRNAELAQAMGEMPDFSVGQLTSLEEELKERGTTSLLVNRAHFLYKGDRRPLPVLIATAEDAGWPMCDHVWIRDQAQAGQALAHMWELDPARYAAEGQTSHELLSSAMDLMSTPHQLSRFANVIAHADDQKYISHPHNWPHIFLALDNLNAKKREGWNHKQDAWQMLGIAFIDALEAGLIPVEEFNTNPNWKQLLGMMVPFLAATGIVTQRNFGSWEEVAESRSSVVGVNLALVQRIAEFASTPAGGFLPDIHKQLTGRSLYKHIGQLSNEAVTYLAHTLPRESRTFDADAALLYLLDYRVDDTLSAHTHVSADQIREAIVRQVETLRDQRTGGIQRYRDDSYERIDFFTHGTQEVLGKMYANGSSDRTGRQYFEGRDTIVPTGPAAAWTHFVAQLGTIEARRFLETGDAAALESSRRHLVTALSLVTGAVEHTVKPQRGGLMDVVPIGGWQMPECYVTWSGNDEVRNEEIITPSPNTPLNWATAKLAELVAYSVKCSQMQEPK